MSADDVARALMWMDDREARVRVATGDLAAVGADGRPEHEQELLAAAAAAVPGDDEVDVAGFQMVSFAPSVRTRRPDGRRPAAPAGHPIRAGTASATAT